MPPGASAPVSARGVRLKSRPSLSVMAKNGVLRVELPKAEAGKRRAIVVPVD